MNKKIISVVITLICMSSIIECKKTLMCFYSLSDAPSADDIIEVSDLCTHLILDSFAYFKDTNFEFTITSYYTRFQNTQDILEKVDELKKKNRSLKILLSFMFGTIYESERMIKKFAKNLVFGTKAYNFDGVDLMWINSSGQTTPEQVLNYIIMMQEIKKLMEKDGLLLVIRSTGKKEKIRKHFWFGEMVPYLDYFLLSTFDLHDFSDGKIGASAPLHYSDSNSVASAVEEYIKLGIPRNKILLGFPTHGRTFLAHEILTRNFMGIPANTSFTDLSARYSYINFNKICQLITPESNWTEHWHSFSSTPFLTNERKLITYDNKRSYLAKLKYLKEQKLGGAVLSTLNNDDYNGICYGEKFYLTKIIKNEFEKEEEEDEEEEEEPTIPVKITSITIQNVLYNL